MQTNTTPYFYDAEFQDRMNPLHLHPFGNPKARENISGHEKNFSVLGEKQISFSMLWIDFTSLLNLLFVALFFIFTQGYVNVFYKLFYSNQ